MPTISTLTVDITSRTSGFSRGLKIATAGLAALAVGAAYAFNKFEESENVLQQTDAVLKSTGDAAKVTSGHVTKLADSLSRLSGVDDETIQSGENMLLTFKNIRNEVGAGNDIFDQAAKASLDLAAGMAAASGGTINMKSSTIQLGKALNDPIAGMSSLTRVGVQFSEEQQHQIEQLVKHNNLLGAQKVILAEVTSQFQGSAKAQATTSGEVSVAFENLAEVVGGLLAPAIRVLADGLTSLIGFIQDNAVPAWQAFSEGVLKVWNAVKPFAQTIGGVLIPILVTAWNAIKDKLLPALERIKPLLIVIGAAILLFATMIVAQFALAVTAVSFLVDAFLDLVGFVRDKVVEPVVNFLARIADAIGKVVGWVKDRLVGAWEAAKGPILAVLDAVIAAIEKMVGWIQTAIHWLSQLGQGVGESLGKAIPPTVLGPIPGAASGGFVERSGMAIIHKGETLTPAGMGSGVTVNVTGWVGNDQQIARRVRDELVKLGKRNVTTGI